MKIGRKHINRLKETVALIKRLVVKQFAVIFLQFQDNVFYFNLTVTNHILLFMMSLYKVRNSVTKHTNTCMLGLLKIFIYARNGDIITLPSNHLPMG